MSLGVVTEKEIDIADIVKQAKQLSKEIKEAQENFKKFSKESEGVKKSFEGANSALRQMKMHNFSNIISAATKLVGAVASFEIIRKSLKTSQDFYYRDINAQIAKTDLQNSEAFRYMLKAKGLDKVMGYGNVAGFAEQMRTPDSAGHILVSSILGLENSEKLRRGEFNSTELFLKTIEALKGKMANLSEVDKATFWGKNGINAAEAVGMSYNQFEMLAGRGDLLKEYQNQLESLGYAAQNLSKLGEATNKLYIAFEKLGLQTLDALSPALQNLVETLILATELLSKAVDHIVDNVKSGFSYVANSASLMLSGAMNDIRKSLGLTGEESDILQKHLSLLDSNQISNVTHLMAKDKRYLEYWRQNKSLPAGENWIKQMAEKGDFLRAPQKNNNILSDSFFERLKGYEGYSANGYVDTNGKMTYGYGTQIDTLKEVGLAHYLNDNTLDKGEAEHAMKAVMTRKIANFVKMAKNGSNFYNLPKEAREFIADIIYNSGEGNTSKNPSVLALLENDYAKSLNLYSNSSLQSVNRHRRSDNLERLKNLQNINVNVYLDGKKIQSQTMSALDNSVASVGTLPQYQ